MKTLKTPKTTHEIPVADSIWEAFELMASDMGSDRDSLINQALFMFARLNGYLNTSVVAAQIPSGVPVLPTMVPAAAASEAPAVPAAPAAVEAPSSGAGDDVEKTPAPAAESEEAQFAADFDDSDFDAAPAESPASSADATPEPPPPAPEEDDFLKEETPAPAPAPHVRRSGLPPPTSRRSGSGLPPPRRSRLAPPPPEPEEPEAVEDQFSEEPQPEEDDRKAVAERVLETAAELERLIKGNNGGSGDGEDEEGEVDFPVEPPKPRRMPPAAPPPRAKTALKLYIVNHPDGGDAPVNKDRYIIGRGKHCDLVINSGKVSREHAAITRENGAYFIQDLGSSNGTWYNKQRLTEKQQIEDGDEFYICSEKVMFALR